MIIIITAFTERYWKPLHPPKVSEFSSTEFPATGEVGKLYKSRGKHFSLGEK